MKSLRTFWQQSVVPYPLEWLLSITFFLYQYFFSPALYSSRDGFFGEWVVVLMSMLVSVATTRLFLKVPIKHIAYWCAPLFVCWFKFSEELILVGMFWYMGLTRQWGNRAFAQHIYTSSFELLRVVAIMVLYLLYTGGLLALFRSIDATALFTIAEELRFLLEILFYSFITLVPLLSTRKISTRLANATAPFAYCYVFLPILAIQTLATYYFLIESFVGDRNTVLQSYGLMLSLLFFTGFCTNALAALQEKAIRFYWQRLFGLSLLPFIATIWWKFYTMMPNGPVYRIHWAYLVFSFIVLAYALIEILGKKRRFALIYTLSIVLWTLYLVFR